MTYKMMNLGKNWIEIIIIEKQLNLSLLLFIYKF
jgi:hypothetical protein